MWSTIGKRINETKTLMFSVSSRQYQHKLFPQRPISRWKTSWVQQATYCAQRRKGDNALRLLMCKLAELAFSAYGVICWRKSRVTRNLRLASLDNWGIRFLWANGKHPFPLLSAVGIASRHVLVKKIHKQLTTFRSSFWWDPPTIHH